MMNKGFGDRNNPVWVWPLIVGMGWLLGCGAKTTSSRCQETYRQLLAKAEEEYCSPILYNHFESQVTEWRGQCVDANVREKNTVTEKLRSAQACSEASRRNELLRTSCRSRLDKLLKPQNCIGDECQPLTDEITKVATQCDVPDLKGAFSPDIEAVKAGLEERTTEAKALKSLQKLMLMCDDIHDLKNVRQAKARLTQIINGIAGTEALGASQPDGSVREQFQNGARASCGFALLEVMNTLTDLSDKELEKVNKIRQRQKHYVRRYKRYAARLEAVDALALFPEAVAPLKSLLQKLGSDLDLPAPKPRRTAAPSDASEKTGDAETEVADKVPPDESTQELPPDEDEKKKAEASTKETGIEPLS